ncbi:PilW family protein [Uliginosibacterium sp. 31-12]|uniref:PilW family protein n=1 Tax=Uliginosibacterium sp. 31-12 TaxID=3062781 RepID=UPI0026E3A232|nr:PilW family protein [Uliginosibacterium sp. 31-12]MDO6384681.1 PilW family protein [Uliginosibacterium sp. 31-12]
MMNKRQPGFSLIELMVALVLSMLVVVALVQIYIGTRQTNRTQEMQARLTEDGRFALSMLQRLISQAGYRPPSEALAADRIAPDATTPSTKFVLRTKGDGTNIVNCNGAAITSGTDTTLTIQFASSKLSCITSGTTPVTTDWIATQTGGRGTEVVDFQVMYGIDTAAAPNTLADDYRCGGAGANRDCVADSYVTTLPTGVTSVQIVAVQLCLILRTEMADAGISKASAVKNCSGTDISNSQTDSKLYRQFQSTVLLRNR